MTIQSPAFGVGAMSYAQPTTAASNSAGHQGLSLGERIRDAFHNVGLRLGFGAASHEIKQAFQMLDNNHSHRIDSTEFGAIGNLFGQGTAAFGIADSNHNALITQGEFRDWVRGTTLQEFQRLDGNGDRVLDGTEMAAFQQSQPYSVSSSDANHDARVTFQEYLGFRVSQLHGAAMSQPHPSHSGLQIPGEIFYH